MSDLPDLLRRLPRLLYLAAVVTFVWKIGNSYMELSAAARGAGAGLDEAMGSLVLLQKSKLLFFAVQDALYLVADGAIVQVLISIHDRLVRT